jgi:hypothetical protein
MTDMGRVPGQLLPATPGTTIARERGKTQRGIDSLLILGSDDAGFNIDGGGLRGKKLVWLPPVTGHGGGREEGQNGGEREELFTVKFRQPSHEFTFGVDMSFISYPLVLTPVV